MNAMKRAQGGLHPSRGRPGLSRQALPLVAIDDAGAGFSSLGNILRLSPDFIKLDISVIRGIDRDEARREAVAALRRFAADIGSAIVAEGIETSAQLQALRALGIPYGQGFYLARPARLTPGGRVPTRIRPLLGLGQQTPATFRWDAP